jgi:hypothetical protein
VHETGKKNSEWALGWAKPRIAQQTKQNKKLLVANGKWQGNAINSSRNTNDEGEHPFFLWFGLIKKLSKKTKLNLLPVICPCSAAAEILMCMCKLATTRFCVVSCE